MGKELAVSEMLKARGIIGRLVENARQIIVEGDQAVVPLMQGAQAEQLSCSLGGGGTALPGPMECGRVVSAAEGGTFTQVKALGPTVLVEDSTSEFKVGVGDITMRIGPRDKPVLDVLGKGEAPDHGVWVKAAALAAIGAEPHGSGAGMSRGSGKPDTAGPMASGIMVAMDGGCQRDQLIQTSRALLQVLEQVTKVVEDLLDETGEGNARDRNILHDSYFLSALTRLPAVATG